MEVKLKLKKVNIRWLMVIWEMTERFVQVNVGEHIKHTDQRV